MLCDETEKQSGNENSRSSVDVLDTALTDKLRGG